MRRDRMVERMLLDELGGSFTIQLLEDDPKFSARVWLRENPRPINVGKCMVNVYGDRAYWMAARILLDEENQRSMEAT